MSAIELDFRSFAENTRDGILVNHERQLVYINHSLEQMLGYIPGELEGANFEVIQATDPAAQETAGFNINNKSHNGRFETLFRRKDNSWCPVEVSATEATWLGESATIHVVRDITDRKRREAELLESESQFLQLTQNIDEVFFVRDLNNNRIIYMSPAYEKIWRQSLSSVYETPLSFMESVHPEDRQRIQEIVQQRNETLDGFLTYQYRIVWPNGEVRWIRARTFPVPDENGRPYRVAGIAEDITEHKATEEKLHLNEMQLRQIIDLVPHAIFVKDYEGRFLLINKAISDFYGSTVEALTGSMHHDVHPHHEDVERMLTDDRQVMDSSQPRLIREEYSEDAAGHQHIFKVTKIPFITSDGGQKAVLGVAIDITESKRTETALQLSEERLRHSLQYANVGSWDWNIRTGVLYWSELVAPLFGYKYGEVDTSYQAFLNAIHTDDRQFVQQAVNDCINSDKNYDIDHRVVWPDGSIHWLHESGGVVYGSDGKAERMLGVVSDITRHKLAEEERVALAKQQRDTLVREVHHRIKNNLQGVIGLLRQHVGKNPVLREPLESAIGQINSVAVVYGLHSRSSNKNIILCEMVRAICHSTGGLTGKIIEPFVTVSVKNPVRVSNEEGVPLALILNELVVNAVKHQSVDTNPVEVFVEDVEDGARVRIINHGNYLADDFDFASGTGLGTGLNLVRSLLPPYGCQLQIKNESSGVLTELRLASPVLTYFTGIDGKT